MHAQAPRPRSSNPPKYSRMKANIMFRSAGLYWTQKDEHGHCNVAKTCGFHSSNCPDHSFIVTFFFFLHLWLPNNYESNKRLFITLGNSNVRPDPQLGSHPIQLEHINEKKAAQFTLQAREMFNSIVHSSCEDAYLFLVCQKLKYQPSSDA